MKENCHIVSAESNDCIIIDPGCNASLIIDYIESYKLNALAILNTHGHYDHIGAVTKVKEHFQIPFWIHSEEKKLVKSANLFMKVFHGNTMINVPEIDMFFDKTESPFLFGKIFVQVIATPGHSKGSVCFLIDNYLFTGDTLFKGAVGRVDFPGGSLNQLKLSLKKIADLPRHLIVCPGHGSNSTIENEIINNQKFIEGNYGHNY